MPHNLVALTAVLSFCSLVYEMTIAGCFVLFTGDAPFWQSLTIGLYLAAIGLGTWTCSRFCRGDAWIALWRVELALSAIGAISAAGLFLVEAAFRINQHFYSTADPSRASFLFALGTGHGFTVAVGWLSGFELPLLMRLAAEQGLRGPEAAPRVLGISYFGALAGSLVFSFFLLPSLDLVGTAAVASGLNLAACAYLLSFRPTPLRALALGGAACFWLASLVAGPLAAQLNATSFYAARLGVPGTVLADSCCSRNTVGLRRVIEALLRRAVDVERIPSRIQRIELIHQEQPRSALTDHYNLRPAKEPNVHYGFTLFLDRRYQFYAGSESIYHEFLAHVPIQLFRHIPREVLILGGGDGLLAKELLKYGSRVRSIVNVELDPRMIALAKGDARLRRLNNGAFHDPKVEIIVADAFSFVRTDRRLYDAIYIDFPFPYTYDAAKLYTKEFFVNVGARLRPGGFVGMDYPLADDELAAGGGEGLRRNSIAVNTLKAAGYWTIVPYSTDSPELMPRSHAMNLTRLPDPPDPDPEIARILRKIEVRRFLLKHPKLKAEESDDLVVMRNLAERESMLAFTRERSYPNFEFVDHGITLYALNAQRLLTLEGGRFPFKEDKSLINTVARPTLFKSLQFHARE